MPELKGVETSHWHDADIEVRYATFGIRHPSTLVVLIVPMQWDEYAYADKAQEAKRLKSTTGVQRSNDSKKRFSSHSKKDHIPWSKQLSKKDTREKRRVEKTRKKAWMASTTRVGEEHKEHTALKRTRVDCEEKTVDSAEASDDWTSLAEEERLAKKLKKGKISQAEFDERTLIDP
jgi:ATP-dependent RNA helicase DDX55/SPB4